MVLFILIIILDLETWCLADEWYSLELWIYSISCSHEWFMIRLGTSGANPSGIRILTSTGGNFDSGQFTVSYQ